MQELEKDLVLAENGKLKYPIKISVKEQYRDILGKAVILVPSLNYKAEIQNRKNRLCVTFKELIEVYNMVQGDKEEAIKKIAIMRLFNGTII